MHWCGGVLLHFFYDYYYFWYCVFIRLLSIHYVFFSACVTVIQICMKWWFKKTTTTIKWHKPIACVRFPIGNCCSVCTFGLLNNAHWCVYLMNKCLLFRQLHVCNTVNVAVRTRHINLMCMRLRNCCYLFIFSSNTIDFNPRETVFLSFPSKITFYFSRFFLLLQIGNSSLGHKPMNIFY